MTEIPDEIDDARISERLHDVLTLIMCPIAGCWSLHGAETMIYYDDDADAYVLEAWPVTGPANPTPCTEPQTAPDELLTVKPIPIAQPVVDQSPDVQSRAVLPGLLVVVIGLLLCIAADFESTCTSLSIFFSFNNNPTGCDPCTGNGSTVTATV